MALGARLTGARPSSEPRGGGPFAQRVSRRYAGRIGLVGDAAGYLDPLSGEGISLGFRTARALIDVVAAGKSLRAYEAAYRAASRLYYVMTRLLLLLAAHERLRALALRPAAFAELLAITSGEAPLANVAAPALAVASSGLSPTKALAWSSELRAGGQTVLR